MTDKDKPISRQQQAISDYLDALLLDVPETEETVETPVSEAVPGTVGLEKLVAQVPEVIAEVKVEEIVEAPVQEQVVAEPVEAIVVEEQQVVTPAPQPVLSEIPDWAEQSFQCLLFNVSGLTLAVPLVKLDSVIPWSDKIVETPNKTDWYLGLVNSHGKNVKVIDTALMVLPENRRHTITDDPEERFSNILLVDEKRWGLACDAIGDVIWLNKKDVKWRKNKEKRPWLAGTAIEQMCALIDTEVFADMMDAKTAV